jgi:hypothetical protein
VIDKLLETPGANVAYFYCKYGDEKRNSVDGITRSILAQLLAHNPDLLPYFHDRYCTSRSPISASVSEELLGISLDECRKTYIVIDGLDECGTAARRDITARFRRHVNGATELGSTRCLFVSQEDGHAAGDLHGIPVIKIGDSNRADISRFAAEWHKKIVQKFKTTTEDIQAIIVQRAKGRHLFTYLMDNMQYLVLLICLPGMFIFADLFAKYLQGLDSINELNDQLRSENLPVELDSL